MVRATWAWAICLTTAVVALLVRVTGIVTIDDSRYFLLSILTSCCIIASVIISWRLKPWGSH